jgi:hypothetical protein
MIIVYTYVLVKIICNYIYDYRKQTERYNIAMDKQVMVLCYKMVL